LIRYISLILIFVFLSGVSTCIRAEDKTNRLCRKIILKDEKKIEVKISFGVGVLHISPGKDNELFNGELYFMEEEPEIEYSVYNGKGRLKILSADFNENGNNRVNISSLDEIKKNVWHLKFSPEIPISFHIEMGAAENHFEFGSMQISRLNINSGASDTDINFSKPNPIIMESLIIDAGVSKIIGRNFLNANFKEFKFDGGVGDYEFEFKGKLNQSADINIEMGAAATKLIIDSEVAFKLHIDSSFLCSVKVEGAQKDDGIYTSNNYYQKSNRLNINADTGIGSFKILLDY
jgi:hypothetical protein